MTYQEPHFQSRQPADVMAEEKAAAAWNNWEIANNPNASLARSEEDVALDALAAQTKQDENQALAGLSAIGVGHKPSAPGSVKSTKSRHLHSV